MDLFEGGYFYFKIKKKKLKFFVALADNLIPHILCFFLFLRADIKMATEKCGSNLYFIVCDAKGQGMAV